MHGDDLERLLATCEQEPLHLSGAIQPYGALLAANAGDLRITHASANLAAHLGVDPAAALGRPLAEALGLPTLEARCRGLAEDSREWLESVLEHAGRRIDLVLSRHAGQYLVELQPSSGDEPEGRAAEPLTALTRPPQDAAQLEAYYGAAAAALQRLTGFGRALVYRFLEDGSGEVVAEVRAEPMPAYLGQRFPASDIPRIARRLYVLTDHRLIPDAAAAAVPLVAADGTPPPDQTYADLRSGSPVHLEYLRNMGVHASFSAAVQLQGQLWGLLTCHDERPRFLSWRVRQRCRELAGTFALGVHSHRIARRLGFMEQVDSRIEALIEAVAATRGNLVDGLRANQTAVLGLVEASGAACLYGDAVVTFGRTPARDRLLALDRWFREAVADNPFVSDSLGEQWPPGRDIAATASGVILLRIPAPARGELRFFWFRPERPQEVRWGGDPRKAVAAAGAAGTRLTPRASFAQWVEVTRGRSAPWDLGNRLAAQKFRHTLMHWR